MIDQLPLSEEVLIMRTARGLWYRERAVRGIPLAQQARERGERCKYLARVEDAKGAVLWSRRAWRVVTGRKV